MGTVKQTDDLNDVLTTIFEDLTEDKCSELCRGCTYAVEAAETELNPINYGDAEGFFREGARWMWKQFCQQVKGV